MSEWMVLYVRVTQKGYVKTRKAQSKEKQKRRIGKKRGEK